MPPAVVLDIVLISEEVFMDYIRLLFHCCNLYDEQNSIEEQFLISRLIFLKTYSIFHQLSLYNLKYNIASFSLILE